MPNVSTLTVRLSANSSKLVAEFAKAQKRSRTFSKRVGASIRIVSRAFGALSLAAVSGLSALTIAGTKTADQLAKTADKLGIAANELAGLRFAAEQTGVGVKTLDLGLQRMTRRLAEAGQGTGEAQKAIKELGLDAKELARLSPDEQFRRIADAMALVGSQGERVRLGFKLFDSEAVGLVNTLAVGREGLADFREEAEALGLTLTGTQLKNIQEAADAQNRLSKSFSGLGQQLAATFAPAMEAGSNATADLVSTFTQSIPQMAAYASAVFGITREILDLTEAERKLELDQIEKTLPGAIEKLKNLEAELAENADTVGLLGISIRSALGINIDNAKDNVSRLTNRSLELEEALNKTTDSTESLGHAFGALPSGVGRGVAIFEEASDQLDEIIARQDKLASSASRIFDQTRTPIENYIVAIREAREVLRKGLIDQETFDRFEQQWQNKILDPIEELEGKSKKSLDGVNDAARDLGLTFESAFESAIIEGNKFRDVLKGILQDIIRIIVRKAITEPLGNAIGGLFSGSAPSIGGQGSALPIGSPALAFTGGTVGPPVFNFKIDASGNTDADKILGLMPEVVKQSVDLSVQKIRDLKSKGRI